MTGEESSEIADPLRLPPEAALDHSAVEKAVGLVPLGLLQGLAQQEKLPRLRQLAQACDIAGRACGEQPRGQREDKNEDAAERNDDTPPGQEGRWLVCRYKQVGSVFSVEADS
jgi:hypothetical protein